MPIKTLLVPENGGPAEYAPDTQEGDYSYFYDYTNGQERIIGLHCLAYSLGATIHIEDNPLLVRAFVEGRIEPPELFEDDNLNMRINAGQQRTLPIWNREAKCARLIIKCELDDPNILN